MIRRALALAALAAAAGCGGDDGGDGPAEDRCDPAPGDGPGFVVGGPMCRLLSSYRLFEDLPAQAPAPGVEPYELNSPLFSDYAEKYRFLWIPEGAAATWHDDESFAFPPGTILVKTFAYPRDLRDPGGARDLIETRLLLRHADRWEAASYVYDEDEREARLAIAGAVVDATWIHTDGQPRDNAFVVPDKNQCKNCHAELDDVLGALGPKARHLHRDGQLEAMIAAGRLTGAPDPAAWPRSPVWDDPSDGTLDERARAWLEINCAHCHNPRGAARTSGLDLRAAQDTPFAFGVCKPPVAAGGGSGGRQYSIVPGEPDASILVYRLESSDPEVMMPELGRNLVHAESVALIRAWIEAMEPVGCGGT